MGRNRKELDKESMFKKIMPSAAEVSVEYAAAAELRQAVAEQQTSVTADRTAVSPQTPTAQNTMPVETATFSAAAAPQPELYDAAQPQGDQQVWNAPILNAPILNAPVFAQQAGQETGDVQTAAQSSSSTEHVISVAPGVAESVPISPVASAIPIASPAPLSPTPDTPPVSLPTAQEPPAQENFNLVNLSRIVMEEKQNSAMDKFHCCKCEKCTMDVLAIALNKVKPQYVMVKQGESPISYVSSDISREIVTALVQSILIVKANPRH